MPSSSSARLKAEAGEAHRANAEWLDPDPGTPQAGSALWWMDQVSLASVSAGAPELRSCGGRRGQPDHLAAAVTPRRAWTRIAVVFPALAGGNRELEPRAGGAHGTNQSGLSRVEGHPVCQLRPHLRPQPKTPAPTLGRGRHLAWSGWRWRRDLNPRRVAPHALSSSAAGGSDPFGWVWSRLSRGSAAHCGRPRTYANETTSETKRSRNAACNLSAQNNQPARSDGRVAPVSCAVRVARRALQTVRPA